MTDVIFHDNSIGGGMAFEDMTNLTLENNNVVASSAFWAYRLFQVTGSASGNTYTDRYTLITEPIDLPLSSEPWDGNWIVGWY